MTVKKTISTVSGAGLGAIACCVAFTPTWEGMDKVAHRDRIGTGHPITYCNGLTSADGAVRIGQKFTKAECDAALAKALPKYWDQIAGCIHVPLPDKTAGSLLDAAWNAGPAAVCHSAMLAKMNAGRLKDGCNAFAGWYVTTKNDGVRKVVVGLEDRRNGEDFGDKRQSEKGLCLQGLREGVTAAKGAAVVMTDAAKNINKQLPPAKPAEEIVPEYNPEFVATKPVCHWWMRCK